MTVPYGAPVCCVLMLMRVPPGVECHMRLLVWRARSQLFEPIWQALIANHGVMGFNFHFLSSVLRNAPFTACAGGIYLQHQQFGEILKNIFKNWYGNRLCVAVGQCPTVSILEVQFICLR